MAMHMGKKKYSADSWKQAQMKCHLTPEEIQMAKRLGLNPKKLIANHMSLKSQPWKEPTGEWIRTIFDKQFRLK